MTDVFTPEKRSEVMSKIRGKWTKPEKILHNHLKGRKVKHKMHPSVEGNPDILLTEKNRVIFIDGCFWHGCKRCRGKKPSSNVSFWKKKIKRNVERDKKVTKILKEQGLEVKRIWEHEMKDIDNVIEKIL